MKKNHEEITIIKASDDKLKDFSLPQIDFPEFNDLYLSKLENKKKIRPDKRLEKFNYKAFQEQEKGRLSRKAAVKSTEINTFPSPPPVSVSKKAPPEKENPKILSANVFEKKLSVLSSTFTKDLKDYTDSADGIIVLASPSVKDSSSSKDSDFNGGDFNSDPESIQVFQSPKNRKKFCSPPVQQEKITSTPSVKSPPIKRSSPVKSPLVRSPVRSPLHSPINFSLSSPISNSISRSTFPSSPASTTASTPRTSASITPPPVPQVPTSQLNKIKSFKGQYIRTFRSSVYSNQKSVPHSISSVNSAVEDDEKRELLFKFQLLASKHPQLVSKYSFSMRSDIRVMRSTYQMILKQISVNNRVDNLNMYLLVGFMVFEHFLGKIGFDMEGFSKQQIANAKSYEALLVELGEKEYTLCGMENWCVEVRLFATLAFNAFWFIIAKSISKKTNFDILGFMSLSSNNGAMQENNTTTFPTGGGDFSTDQYNTEDGIKRMRGFSSS